MDPAKKIAQTIVELLKQQGQLSVLPEVVEELNQIVQASMNKVVIETATEVSEDTLNGLIDILAAKMGYTPTVEHIVNPELIAGIRVKIDDNLIDASVKNQLEKIFEKIH